MKKKYNIYFFALPLILFNIINFFVIPNSEFPGDATAVRFESDNLAKTGHFGVPKEIATVFGDRGQYFFHNKTTGAFYPKYGIFNSIAYLPVSIVHHWLGPDEPKEAIARRLLLLNIWQSILSSIVVALIFLLCREFFKDPWICSAFTLAAIFCTFLWHYLRAHSFEVIQLFLFLSALLSAFRYRRGNSSTEPPLLNKELLLCGIALSCLILSKSVFVLLLPVFFFYLADFSTSSPWKSRSNASVFASFVSICTIGFAILLLGNFLKFGHPLNTGYTQWEREADLFSGSLFDGIFGFLFDSQFGVLATFPLLFIALFFWKDFWRDHKRESLLLFSALIVVIVPHAHFVNWRGEWGYGPRYLLLLLPALSLPAAGFFGILRNRKWMARNPLPILAGIIILSASAHLQFVVSRFPFFAFYQLFYSVSDEAQMQLHSHFMRSPQGRVLAEFEKQNPPSQ